MQTNYSRGSEFERFLKKRYEAEGYSVHRMAGSHSPIDLIAISSDEIILIQCKSSTVELLPDVKQLLKPTAMDEVRSKINGTWIKVKQEVKSNVKLLEELEVPQCTTKLVIWKGKGKENYYTFQSTYIVKQYLPGNMIHIEWKGKRGLPI